ncbi:hypothetical protein [Helicobacter suis]|uniref:hypothetical protein n=1 Tax=Helicobacter suis TaxID=104628 RepID=UPI0013CF446A|nr:hypothetical protein [Helicobacter suis]
MLSMSEADMCKGIIDRFIASYKGLNYGKKAGDRSFAPGYEDLEDLYFCGELFGKKIIKRL